MLPSELALTVSDVRQHIYCRRVVYYGYTLGRRRPTTYKMTEGTQRGEDTAELEERRSLRAYGLTQGQRVFDAALWSPRLRLSGRLDMAILIQGEVIPVEYKNTGAAPAPTHTYQLAAYALLAEEHWELPALRGFVYLIPRKKAYQVAISDELRQLTTAVLERIRADLSRGVLPEGTRHMARCLDCEFRNFCNDRD